jgi:hypothetical protein
VSHSRETPRDALAALLNTALVGSGKPCQAFYGYQVTDFRGQSPIAMLVSAGSERDQQTMATRRKSFFSFQVVSFVLYADPASSWTEANSQDALDAIEQVVDETIAANLVNGTTWADIGYDGRSQTGIVQILGGDTYRYEVIPVRIEVFHD